VPTARPYWKGYLKLALVSCPIALYTASSSSERVAFRQINKKTGNRLRQQLIDEATRQPVEAEDKGKGYEYAKGQYIVVEDSELEAIEIESNHTIEIDSFVPRAEIDERYLESPYYIAPADKVGLEAFAVIREAMRGKAVVGLGRVVLAKRERIMMLQPWDNGLVGTTLRYPYEVRPAKDYFYDIPEIKVEPDLLKLAEHILKNKEQHFDPEKFVDRYEEAVLEMLKKKQAGLPAPKAKPAFAPPSNVVNLFDAFRRSLAEEEKAIAKPAKPAKAEKPKKGKAKVEGQRELLLPIAGKKGEAAKPAAKAHPAAGRRKAG
jgi:DNA end-binding protein Ku